MEVEDGGRERRFSDLRPEEIMFQKKKINDGNVAEMRRRELFQPGPLKIL